MKTVIITGVSGQDGSYLAEKYAKKGWNVIGIDRWNPTGPGPNLGIMQGFNQETLEPDFPNFKMISGDIIEFGFIERLIKTYQPDILYNMAAISLVPESFKIPLTTFQTNSLAVINMLECIRMYSPKTRFYQASTSEQIGSNKNIPQNTESIMLPTSPYAVAKLASYHMVRVYREAYNLFAVNGMLWNHEGPRRGPDFVTRKITLAVAKIAKGKQAKVTLGNMNSFRDWGSADDFTDAMIMMMEADKPDDYAVATGETHSIREFVVEAFKNIGLDITWSGQGTDEKGTDQNGVVRVEVNKEFYRPAEVDLLFGDPSKIKKTLGWEPKIKFKELVKIMVESDLKLV